MIRCFFLALSMLSLLGVSDISAQHHDPETTRTPQVLEALNQAFQKGQLTLEQKILYQVYALKSPDKLPVERGFDLDSPLKCGTPIIREAKARQHQLSSNAQATMESLLAAPALKDEQTYLSPEGKFMIHYTTVGDSAVSTTDNSGNGIPDYVEWVAAAADSSWRHEVNNLGYTDPVIGPSQPYHVYILNLEYYYGDTVHDGSTTFIRIENDFSEGFPPNDDPDGLQQGAVKVTMAHELKHAVQYAATGWQGESDSWAEMDATLMEEVVYDNVNDYYNYIYSSNSIFNSPETSFYPGSYYHVTWALYFEEKYGPYFWVNVWKQIKQDPSIPLIEVMTRELEGESPFLRNFTESHLWHFASGAEYSSKNFGFEERLNYPNPSVEPDNSSWATDFSIPRESVNSNSLNSFTATYLKVTPPVNASGKVILEISNADPHTGVGIIAYFKDGTADTHVIAQNSHKESGPLELSGWTWKKVDYIGLTLTNSSTGTKSSVASVRIGGLDSDQSTLSQNYPNPFEGYTNIRFTIAQKTRVKLCIYDVAGRLVRTVRDEEMQPGIYEDEINPNKLASGVYFYRLTTDEESITRKMTFIK